MSDATSDQTTTFELPAKLNTAAAEGLYEAFQAHRGTPLTVDASDVTHLGTLCFQVLHAAQKSWAADEKDLSFSGCSEAFMADLDRLGVPAQLFVEGD